MIETIFFGPIEDIKIVNLHVYGSIQFFDADIKVLLKKIYLWKYLHYISRLHFQGQRQACEWDHLKVKKFKESTTNQIISYQVSYIFLSFITNQ